MTFPVQLRSFRIFLVLLILSMAGVQASAQFRYGPVAGVNIDYLNFKQGLVPTHSVVGYQAGVQGEMMFPGIGFGIDLGLIYNNMGAKVNLGSRHLWASQGFGDDHVQLHSLQIPLHLRFKWTRMNGLEEKIAPFVYGGPDFSILLGHTTPKGNPGTRNPYDFAGGELGLTAGLGFELWRHWQISAAHTWGMTYILKTALLDDNSARQRQWTVRVAYLF